MNGDGHIGTGCKGDGEGVGWRKVNGEGDTGTGGMYCVWKGGQWENGEDDMLGVPSARVGVYPLT